MGSEDQPHGQAHDEEAEIDQPSVSHVAQRACRARAKAAAYTRRMTANLATAAGNPNMGSTPTSYASGRCNIGPSEIARRRNFGHAAAVVTVAAFVGLLLVSAPAWTRVLLFFPAAGAAAGYLQAALHFCADYGWRGVFNFGRAGHHRTTAVTEADARRADRRMALFIGGASAAVGVLVALLALVSPLG